MKKILIFLSLGFTIEPKPESPEDDAEFERVLRNLVNTPHKPHEKKARELKPGAQPPD